MIAKTNQINKISTIIFILFFSSAIAGGILIFQQNILFHISLFLLSISALYLYFFLILKNIKITTILLIYYFLIFLISFFLFYISNTYLSAYFLVLLMLIYLLIVFNETAQINKKSKIFIIGFCILITNFSTSFLALYIYLFNN